MANGPDQERSVLPPPDPPFRGEIKVAFADSTADFPEPLRAPEGAPNVLVIVGDDIGYGHMGAFGGPARTPTFDRLAERGLKYTNYHVTAVCSASRAALLTGRNSHSVGMGVIPESSTGFPGYNAHGPAQRRDRVRDPAPERLRHCLDRQDPPHPAARSHGCRTVRSLAGRHGRRVLLRFLRCRREPVASAAVGEHDAVGGAENAGGGLSPGGRHGRQDDRLDRAAEVDPSREAVDRVLRAERAQAAGRRAERVHGAIPRRVRRRL